MGYLMVWADNGLAGGNVAGLAALHAPLKLKKSGGSIAFFDPTTNGIDLVEYGPQSTDVSAGRYPDGGPLVYRFVSPTLGKTNFYTNSAPVLGPLGPIQANAGEVFRVAFQASEVDSPPQSLTYLLEATGGSGAVLVSISGMLTWETDPQVPDGTYLLKIRVTDNGSPPLSDTRSIKVNVHRGTPPSVSVGIPALGGTRITFSWSSRPGTSYRIQTVTNLDSGPWVDVPGDILASSEISSKSLELSGDDVERFYRVRIVP